MGFVIYPYLKRFTWLCHVWLGAVDGLAPMGAWVAIRGDLPWQAWALGGAVALWVGGFDLYYALFDVGIDRAQGLHSMPVDLGVRATFWDARLWHAGTIALLVAAGLGLSVGAGLLAGVAIAAALLAYEHSLVRPDDLQPPRHRVLHHERRDQRGVLRLRDRRRAALGCRGTSPRPPPA